MARDTQRKRVYDAENAAFAGQGNEGLTVPECQAFVDKCLASKVLQEMYPRAREQYTVTDGRGRSRTACYMPGCEELRIPRFARRRWILLHELAHALTHANDRAWHGWEFCSCYLYLVRVFLGRGAAETLLREFRSHRVKYREPRRRQMTEAQRQAARERMLAWHASRQARQDSAQAA